MFSPKILCVSFDRVASENRCSALKEAGYDVTASTDVKEALELLSRETFDAVIVGHRFAKEDRYLLAAQAKEKANTPVVLVCGATSDSEIPATSRVFALEGNTGLLFALSQWCPAETAAQPAA
ncbi:MAG: response regulator [Candidatus Sulfotelmatobacter sp.]